MNAQTPRIAKRRGRCAVCGLPYAKGDATAIYDLRRNAHAACMAGKSTNQPQKG